MIPADLDRLRASGLVRDLEFHAEIGSTNDRAIQLAGKTSLLCPFLVIAAQQTAGRGRGSNSWWSRRGALTASLLIEPREFGLERDRWPLVALATGLAVCQSVAALLPGGRTAVKWPNDVYIDGKKAAGILVEAPAQSPDRLVIGIGLNVNNPLTGAPAEIQNAACALCDLVHGPLNLADVLMDVLGRLSGTLELLVSSPPAFFDEWRSYCLLTGKRIELVAGDRRFVGRCGGIDDRGELIVETSEGMQTHRSGTVARFD